MNNGSKSTQPRVPTGIQQSTTSPVGATSNLHIQKEAISQERDCADELSARLHLSPSNKPPQSPKSPTKNAYISGSPLLNSPDKSKLQGNIISGEKLLSPNTNIPKVASSDSNVVRSVVTTKNKSLTNILEQSSKSPSFDQAKNPKLNWSISEGGRGRNDTTNANSDSEHSKDPIKSRKFVKHWKEAASMSKLGNRTKSFLQGKFKPHSQSVDMVNSQDKTHPAYSGVNSSTTHGPNSILSNSNLPKSNKNGTIIGSDPSSTSDVVGSASTEGKTSTGKKGVLKHNPSISQIHSESTSDTPKNKAKTQWSEHVWTAWVHRGFSDDVTEKAVLQPGHELISDFQKDKFRHFFFHVLDHNADCVISLEDFEKLNERIRHYMDWSKNTTQFLVLKEIHSTFLDCFLTTAATSTKSEDDGFDFWDPFKNLDRLYDKNMEHASLSDLLNDVEEPEPRTCVTIDEWIDVWGTIVGKAKNMDDLPMWLQYYPRTLFDVINRTGTGTITKSELKHFYTAFMDVGKLGDKELDDLTTKSFNALTSNGEVKLTYHIYKLSFMNFLLGKQPNGPGQYLFGMVKPKAPTCMFPIDYSAMNATEEDMEPFRHDKLEEKGSRRSVIV